MYGSSNLPGTSLKTKLVLHWYCNWKIDSITSLVIESVFVSHLHNINKKGTLILTNKSTCNVNFYIIGYFVYKLQWLTGWRLTTCYWYVNQLFIIKYSSTSMFLIQIIAQVTGLRWYHTCYKSISLAHLYRNLNIRPRHSIKGQAQRPCRVWLELLKAYLNAHSVTTYPVKPMQSK